MGALDVKAWRCNVCGYVHNGENPPEDCPICGVSSEEFTPYVETPAESDEAKPRRWRCAVCGYIHEGDEPPERCELCGADRGQFEAVTADVGGTVGDGGGRIVIVGAGIAGVSAAESARKSAPKAHITLLNQEAGLPYYRLNLTRYLAGEVGSDALPIHPQSWYAEQRIELRSNEDVVRLDLENRLIKLRGGETCAFDKLVLACGAHAFVPPIPGAQREGVVSLRTAGEADAILDAAGKGARIVCVGGGLLGLETAGALARRKADVTVVESFGSLMPRQLDPQGGRRLADHISRIGVRLLMSVHVKELVGDVKVKGVQLEEGDIVPADLVILATGVRSNTHLARQAGLNVKQGIVVDNLLTTSHPAVLAAGDSAEHAGVLYGNWYVAQTQGTLAGMNAAGRKAEFGGVPRSHALKVLGLDTFSIGQFLPQDGSYRCVREESAERYFSFVFRDNAMIGANLLGDTRLAAAVKKAVETRKDASQLLRASPSVTSVCEWLERS